MSSIIMQPIGAVRSTRSDVRDDAWDQERTYIELDPAQFGAEALTGLEDFSHAEIVFLMDRVDPTRVQSGARHPRNQSHWPRVGIFAQRAKNRPNRLGLSVCGILRVEGLQLHVQGLDAVDGTPVLDVKPWVDELGPRGQTRQPSWITELMRHYF